MGHYVPSKQIKVNKKKITLEQAIKAQSGSRGIAQIFLPPRRNIVASVQRHAPAALPPVKNVKTSDNSIYCYRGKS